MKTKKFILDRRTLLKGAGVGLALPMLEAMMPTLSRAQNVPKPILINCVWPNGLPGFYEQSEARTTSNGHNTFNSSYHWKCYPEYAINHYLSRLSPLAKQMSSVIPNSTHNWDGSFTGHEAMAGLFSGGPGAGRYSNMNDFLNRSGDPNMLMAESYDQRIARELGLKTLNAMGTKGYYGNPYKNEAQGRKICDPISWYRYRNANGQYDGTHRAVDLYDQPFEIYDLVVGNQSNAPSNNQEKLARRQLLLNNDTILSKVMDSINKLNNNLGSTDKKILEEYLQGVRDIDRKVATELQTLEGETSTEPKTCTASFSRPASISQYDFTYATMERRVKLFQELFTLAMECDLYQNFGLNHGGRASGIKMYPSDGNDLAWHSCSHWRFVDGGASTQASGASQDAQRKRYAQFGLNQISMFADWMNTLAVKKQVNGRPLLERVSAVLTTDLNDGNSHLNFGIPVFMAGGGNGAIPNHNGHQFHISKACTWREGVPIGNLWLSIIKQLGINESKIGASTGIVTDFDKAHS